jgi:hypothetical protein
MCRVVGVMKEINRDESAADAKALKSGEAVKRAS